MYKLLYSVITYNSAQNSTRTQQYTSRDKNIDQQVYRTLHLVRIICQQQQQQQKKTEKAVVQLRYGSLCTCVCVSRVCYTHPMLVLYSLFC